MTSEFDRTHIKVLVHTKPKDGYPPEEWEGLWAIPIGANRFKIDNIPFYARDVSCGDVVEACLDNGEHIFKRVVEPSANSTIRVVIYDLADESAIRSELIKLGCSVEGSGTPGLIALNVPKANVEDVVDLLEIRFVDEKLDFEEGAIR